MKLPPCDALLDAAGVAELTSDFCPALDLEKWTRALQPLLTRFHLRLTKVDEAKAVSLPAFVGDPLEKQFLAAAAISGLGTWLYGGFGSGRGTTGGELAKHKRRADAVSAFILSEALSVCSRELPSSHALLVGLGEGRMLKAGESLEGGNNPRIAFGHVFADSRTARDLHDSLRVLAAGASPGDFARDLRDKGLVVWGTAIDNLENTSRFALGCATGPAVVFHVFDQPLTVAKPFECYMGMLTLPEDVVRVAKLHSSPLNFLTPRREVLRCIQEAYPHVPVGNIHVWTLSGAGRSNRLSGLWREWSDLGVRLVEHGWIYPPTGRPVFTDSGTYLPTYCVGEFGADGQSHLFLVDGYAASTEAIQAASLNSALRQRTFLYSLTESFQHPLWQQSQIMRIPLDRGIASVQQDLDGILGRKASEDEAHAYANELAEIDGANMPRGIDEQTVANYFSKPEPDALAVSAIITDDPYSGIDGIRQIDDSTYAVCARAVSNGVNRIVRFTFEIAVAPTESGKAFLPLLDAGWDQRRPAAPILDAAEIESFLNELRVLFPDCVQTGKDGVLFLNVGPLRNTNRGVDDEDPTSVAIARIMDANPDLKLRLKLQESGQANDA